MGKKKRVLLNPMKFGEKNFEFYDNLDGVDDDIIASTVVPVSLRTLGLVDNGDRTISINAQLFGSSSAKMSHMGAWVHTTGGVTCAETARDTSFKLKTLLTMVSSGSTGFIYSGSLPFDHDHYSPGPFVFPAGITTIEGIVTGPASDPGSYADSTIVLRESITVSEASIGLTSAQLSGALSGAIDGSTALSVDLAAMEGTAPQHGSGSGVGAGSSTYAPDDGGAQHGYHITVSGTVSGAVNLAGTATANNGHSNSGVVVIADQTNMNASGSQDITITFTPRDVNNQLSTDQAVTTTLTLS